jgi:iron-sulfur cluster assembly protein
MISLTENAARAVQKFIQGSTKPVKGLRIAVEGGGCTGFKYSMRLEEFPAQDDELIETGGVNLLIDQQSAPMLQGVVVDFTEGMEGSGFKFENPNATASCGCGKSFAC